MTADVLADPERSFQDALSDVERRVEAFAAKSEAEATNKAEKLKALYDALEQAYSFHRTWFERPEYQAMLKEKGIAAKGSERTSTFTPTIKALFDPELDRLQTAGDADKRREKVRRQKTVSAYCSSLEFAQHQSRADVAKLLAEKNGIEEARKAWAKLKPKPTATTKPSPAKKTKYEAGLQFLKEKMRQTLPDAPENAHRTFLAVMYIDEHGKSHILGQVEDGTTARRLVDDFVRRNAPVEPNTSLKLVIANLENLPDSPTAKEARQALGPHKQFWSMAVAHVKDQMAGETETPALNKDAHSMLKASHLARRMWGKDAFVGAGKNKYATAAERATEDALYYWELLPESEKVLFDFEGGGDTPLLRKQKALTRAETHAQAREICLGILSDMLQGNADVATPPRKMSGKEATKRLKRLQSSIGKPFRLSTTPDPIKAV